MIYFDCVLMGLLLVAVVILGYYFIEAFLYYLDVKSNYKSFFNFLKISIMEELHDV